MKRIEVWETRHDNGKEGKWNGKTRQIRQGKKRLHKRKKQIQQKRSEEIS
jgi:hypothetical protein